MKKLFLLPLIVLVAAITLFSQSGRRITNPQPTYTAPVQPPINPEPPVKTTSSAPIPLMFLSESLRERKIKGVDKGDFKLADFDGKVLVINIWATWCGPCRREVPDYERVRKSYEGQEVEFVALTAEDPKEAGDAVRKFVRQSNWGFRVGWADRELARTLMNGKGGIPQTIVTDPQGRIIKHWTGYAAGRSADRLRDAIDSALPQKTQ